MSDMGKLLIEGDGENCKTAKLITKLSWIVSLFLIITWFVIHFLLLVDSDTSEARIIFDAVIMGGGGFLLLSFGVPYGTGMSKSYIKVYENGIKGKSVRGKEYLFMYDQISVVDIEQNGSTYGFITINSHRNNYKTYVKNAKEIQQAIHKQKNALQQK
jgi:hypothetical protein